MNDKNKKDSFRELIDSIQLGEQPEEKGGTPEEPVPEERFPAPAETEESAQDSGAQAAASQEKEPVLPPEEEELPSWLTEKRRPDPKEELPITEDPVTSAAESTSGQAKRAPEPMEMVEPTPVPIKSAAKVGKPPKKKIKKQYRVGRALLLTALFLCISIYLAFFATRAFEDLTGVTLFGGSAVEKQMTIEIPKGASVSQITKILKEGGVISEPFAFKLYIMLKKEDGFQSGEYIMTDKMDYDAIIYALQSGDNRTDVVNIMFPEGSTTADIASKLEEQGVCSASEFLAALNASYNYNFVETIPQNDLRFYKLEGYLFPNTHQFFVGESVDSVVNRFLKDFNAQITDEMRTRMNELNLTLDQTLTLASIIQKEASDPDEMANVSEVFHNRLNNSDVYPNLQSDPTINYVEKVIKKNIGMANQEMYNAYNTYVCTGLPVGPICNPGLDAIKAALYPAQHEATYYYFITDNEGTYYYAQTLAEHNANIAKADKVNAQLAKNASSAAK